VWLHKLERDCHVFSRLPKFNSEFSVPHGQTLVLVTIRLPTLGQRYGSALSPHQIFWLILPRDGCMTLYDPRISVSQVSTLPVNTYLNIGISLESVNLICMEEFLPVVMNSLLTDLCSRFKGHDLGLHKWSMHHWNRILPTFRVAWFVVISLVSPEVAFSHGNSHSLAVGFSVGQTAS